MFDVKQCEKEIVLALLKREMALRKLNMEQTSHRLGITESIFNKMMDDKGKYYTTKTIMFWTEATASDHTPEEILNSKLHRRSCPRPKDPFYRELWDFIASIDAEKNSKI